MREQVISPRGVRRSAAQTKGMVQRPMRRDGAARSNFSLRTLFAYVPSALKIGLAVVILIGLIVGYRAAASASLFQVRTIDVSGTSRTSSQEIESFTRRAVMRTGVWRADLNAISNELSRLPGIKRAVVSRVLPDRLRVRVVERTPLAVVRTSQGRFAWVDEDGVMLGEVRPEDRMPTFFIHGWNEEGTEEARKENVERVQKYEEALRDWSAEGLAERVSEITLIDLRDIRAQLAGNESQVEVRLGPQDLGPRLKIALAALDMYKQTPRGSSITYVDVQTGRVVIGFNSGGKLSTDNSLAPAPSPTSAANTPDAIDSAKAKTQKTATNDNQKSNHDKSNAPTKNKELGGPALRFR